MESKNTISNAKDQLPTSNYDEVLLRHSLLFSDGLKDLRNVREQLYSAAEHFEDSYKNDQKQMLLESLKDYISKSLIKTVDHLGSVTHKVNKFLDEHVNDVSETKLRLACMEQSLQTCQEYANHGGLSQKSLMVQTLKYHKHYPVQEACITEDIKAEKEMIQSSGLRKEDSEQPPSEFPVAFSFAKAASHQTKAKRSRSMSPLRFPIKRSGSTANQSTCPSFSVKLSASSNHRSISPCSSTSRQQVSHTISVFCNSQKPTVDWRSQSVCPQRQSPKAMQVYSKKTRNLFKALLSMYKSKKNII
uniref:protein ABIL2-like n=1 Tax=Erigeron canadensis TaxID=72917 RepID=UPI001CB9639A|nr:protein ABIL2-like [Erigeron canadensis]